MKIISIIPARGGSKGLEKKNIKPFVGKPLIGYAIEESKKAKKINRTFVSTENAKIAKIAKDYGSEVIERPMNLAKDDSSTIEVIYNVMEQLKDEFDDSTIIILLQSTSPLRTVNDIENCIELFLNEKCDSVVSVCEVSHPPYWCLKIENGFLKSLFGDKYLKMRRQNFENVYSPNGAIYITRFGTLKKSNTFLCKSTIPYIMTRENSIDIDNELDFSLAELIYRKNENKQ